MSNESFKRRAPILSRPTTLLVFKTPMDLETKSPLRDELNRNKETETNRNERITKTNGRSMKYGNTDN